MRQLGHAMFLGGLAMLAMGVAVGAAGVQDQKSPTPGPSVPLTPEATSAIRQMLSGVWVYNEDDSLNAANGRKEAASTALRRTGTTAGGATTRTRTGSGGGAGGGSGMGGAFGGGGNGGYGGYGYGSGNGGASPSPWASLVVNEKRDLVRDLFEVPVELTIKLSDGSVTFTDDLERALTYPTSGRRQKYQLSASVFQAKAYWDGVQFKKDIEGTDGFRMHETYFVSDDGKRLFVIIRLGDPSDDKEAPVVGVNRVYDRADDSGK